MHCSNRCSLLTLNRDVFLFQGLLVNQAFSFFFNYRKHQVTFKKLYMYLGKAA